MPCCVNSLNDAKKWKFEDESRQAHKNAHTHDAQKKEKRKKWNRKIDKEHHRSQWINEKPYLLICYLKVDENE